MSFMVIRPSRRSEGGRNFCLERTQRFGECNAISWWKTTGVELRRSDMLILLTVVRWKPFCSHCCQAPEVSLSIVSALVWAWLKCTVLSDMFKAGRCGKIIGSGRGRGQGRGKKGVERCWDYLSATPGHPTKYVFYCQVAIENCYSRMFMWRI